MTLVIADCTVKSQAGQYFVIWIAFLDNDLTHLKFRFSCSGDYSDELSTDSVLCGKFDSFYCRTTVFQNSSHAEGALKVKTAVVCG